MAPKLSDKKPKKSIRLTATKRGQLKAGLTKLREHYAPLAEVWGEIPPEKREEILAHSPVLRGFLDFCNQFIGGV